MITPGEPHPYGSRSQMIASARASIGLAPLGWRSAAQVGPAMFGSAALALGFSAGVIVCSGERSALMNPALLAATGVLFLGLVAVTWSSPVAAFVALVVGLPFHQVVLAWLYGHGAPIRALGLMRFWKEFLIAVLILRYLSGSTVSWSLVDRLVLAFVTLSVAYVLLPIGPPVYVRLLGFRQECLFLVLFFLARHMPMKGATLTRVEPAVLTAGVVVAALAIWNALAPGGFADWIQSTGLNTYRLAALDVVGPPVIAIGSQRGLGIIRAGSIFLSPVATAYFLMIAVGVALGRLGRDHRTAWSGLAGLICVVGVLSTRTRSAIALIPLLAAAAWLRTRRRGRVSTVLVVGAVALLPLVGSLQLTTRLASGLDPRDSSTAGHIEALIYSRDRVINNPFGTGLGTSSAVSRRFQVDGSITNESWYFQVATELGLLGLAIYAFFVMLTLRALWLVAQRSDVGVGPFCLMLALVVGGLVLHNLEEAAVAWTGWILAGLALRRSDEVGAAGSVHLVSRAA